MTSWEKVGFVLASEYRKRMILSLAVGPKTPKQLSNVSKLYLSHVSLSLKELEKAGLVECLTPKLRRGRIYSLTEEGKKVSQKLN